ncbi:MAG: histidine kinase [Ramlibacter sp.]|nr:histidine kinase [Ramlibacter sp.]
MLQAVGHEILSPLQSLMVLHPKPDDEGHRYVQRMQQAVKVLYGQASPSEALQAANLDVGTINLDQFLHHVAGNAHFAGIEGVCYQPSASPVIVRAEEFSLEDVVTHILRNADRHRTPGTPITMELRTQEPGVAQVVIHNQGAPIADVLLARVFDYGVSGTEPATSGQRGQGLFVARTYMRKMGGSIEARNEHGGVSLLLTLQRAA